MIYFFGFFFLSGFCSILYELIWLRLAMAHFGVTSGVVSVVISSFMSGIGLGSLIAGYLLKHNRIKHVSIQTLYACTELLIGTSVFVVPLSLTFGSQLITPMSSASSVTWVAMSAVWIALTLIPWCFLMGATIPIGMQVAKTHFHRCSQTSFSYLYVANVSGAFVGTLLPLLFIELYGFHHTLFIGSCINAFIAIMAFSIRLPKENRIGIQSAMARQKAFVKNNKILLLLFFTGFTSMGLEVVWVRIYTPYLGTVVYAFASILGTYLLSTFIGSRIYRRDRITVEYINPFVWFLLFISCFMPLLFNSLHVDIPNLVRLILGIGLFSMVLGYITPALIDQWSGGQPDKAGYAYAVNVMGCILGPLVVGFILLPLINEAYTIYILSLPLFLACLAVNKKTMHALPLSMEGVGAIFFTIFIMAMIPHIEIYRGISNKAYTLRDNTATVMATGSGMHRQLEINGYGMTILTPITKYMAHLPAAFLSRQPRTAANICFGMGTTFRSLLSWDMDVTAVELVASVPKMFSYYHADASQIKQKANAHIVIDDGRRYLKQSTQTFDIISIDPPPPAAAAASSLLYSTEFYAITKKRLSADGILQQWLPPTDDVTKAAVTRALLEAFQYVRAFKSVDNNGIHYLASDQPIPALSAKELAVKLPSGAKQDFIEWGPGQTVETQFALILKNEISPQSLVTNHPGVPAIQDDFPVNEYYLLR